MQKASCFAQLLTIPLAQAVERVGTNISYGRLLDVRTFTLLTVHSSFENSHSCLPCAHT